MWFLLFNRSAEQCLTLQNYFFSRGQNSNLLGDSCTIYVHLILPIFSFLGGNQSERDKTDNRVNL